MYMKKYGKMLMNEDSEKTTELLKCLCTDYRPSDSEWLELHLNIASKEEKSPAICATYLLTIHRYCLCCSP